MCRNAKFCSELGTDPKKWSKRSPLQPPKYFDKSLNYFIKAFEAAQNNQKKDAIKFLKLTEGDKLRDWYIEHGQMSGWHHRVKALNKPKIEKYTGDLEKNKSFSKFEAQVYQRDGYRCRYCSMRVIDRKALLKIEKLLGPSIFKVKGTNQQRHGVVLVFRATIDHVKPLSRGGRTSLNNLVTSCWSCNYGKLNATLKQIQIQNPFDYRVSIKSKWNGLVNHS